MLTFPNSNLKKANLRKATAIPPQIPSIAATCIAILICSACGYSEKQWQGKLSEIESLNAQLQAEQQGHRKTQDDYNNAREKVDELNNRLTQAGIDVEQLHASLEEQRMALEEFKRRAEQLETMKKRFELLRTKLDSLVKLGLTVSVRNNRMVISMPGDVLFDSGKVDLKKEGTDILAQVAAVIRSDAQLSARTFQVAGHTDNRPLGGGPYKDNWGLSLMRARQVLIFLVGPIDNGGGLNATRWSAAGYGDTDPIVANVTPEDMRRNRRVELIVLPNVEEMLDLQSLTR
ncbi:MAG: OmpA family protein [Polyangiaceae bacterium]|nr:OmpA family protein [Polyangiaceae bacterium]